jgi:hypothetical protein
MDKGEAVTRYVSIPQEVQATQWTGDNEAEMLAISPKVRIAKDYLSGRVMCEVYAGVNGATGWVFVPVGDWVLHWADDLTDLWPMNDQAFRRKYRPAEDEGIA